MKELLSEPSKNSRGLKVSNVLTSLRKQMSQNRPQAKTFHEFTIVNHIWSDAQFPEITVRGLFSRLKSAFVFSFYAHRKLIDPSSGVPGGANCTAKNTKLSFPLPYSTS